MATTSHGVGGLTFDSKKRALPPEAGVFVALIVITIIFEVLNRINGSSFLFNVNDKLDLLFNKQRLDIMILQVAIIGIISLGVTQVIIVGGIDLSSGSVVGATAMIVMSFGQTALVNGNPNPKAIFGDWAMDLPVIAPIAVGVACGLFAGLVNGLLIAYTKIPPFIATLGMMVSARGVARWWSNGNPVSFPTEGYAHLSNGDVVGTLTFGLVSIPVDLYPGVRDVRETIAPSPTPGKMYELLPWRGTKVWLPSVTESNGEPQANSARPSDQRYACVAVHSALDVGFDSAKTMGRLLSADIVRTISSVKAPPTAATPMIAVGRSALTASSRLPTGG